jgi:hypothetical protein
MRMVIDEAGDHRPASQVDALRVGASQPLDVGVSSDGDDAIAADGDRLSDLERVIDGDDLSIRKNEVSAGLLRVQR